MVVWCKGCQGHGRGCWSEGGHGRGSLCLGFYVLGLVGLGGVGVVLGVLG